MPRASRLPPVAGAPGATRSCAPRKPCKSTRSSTGTRDCKPPKRRGQEHTERERHWWERQREALGDAAAARAELDRRSREQRHSAVQVAPYEPGEHITVLIGERPDRGDDVGAWDQAARRIEAYHHNHQPDTPRVEAPAPGASPSQYRDWQHTSEAITRVLGDRAWQRALPARTLGRGRDRGDDLGPDLDLGP